MKALNKKSIIAGLVLGSMMVAGGVSAGVKDSKHNLGSTNSVSGNKTSATDEVCVFCHTPHGSDTGAAVPLWNKTLPLANTFSTYDSLGTSSLDGGITAVGSVSIACLSCHDGSQAMDVMLNTPGSGNILGAKDTGLTAAGGVGGWTANANTTVNGAGVMIIGTDLMKFPMLGTDLKNDHPIGIQYAGGGIHTGAKTPPNTDFGDEDFKQPLNKTVNNVDVWWVETGGNAKRQKTDLPLYTRTDGAVGSVGFTTANPQPFVECASCHDPHESTNKTFLRIPNTGSAVCLACHTK